MGRGLPKAQIDFCGVPLLWHVTQAASGIADRVHVVHGPALTDWLGAHQKALGIHSTHIQDEPRGTADALMCALGAIEDDARVIVLCADTPLLKEDTLRRVLADDAALTLLVLEGSGDSRLGRIVRDDKSQVVGICEYADANEEQRAIREYNSGVVAATAGNFKKWCAQVTSDNAQGELYLTDCVGLAVSEGAAVHTVACEESEGLGVNTPAEYAAASTVWQQRKRAAWMDAGVLLEAPDTLWVSAQTEITGSGVRIGPNVVIESAVLIEGDVHLHANVVLRDCVIGAGTEIHPFSVVTEARVGARCRIGPFARLRPEAELADDVRIGNFVEVKKSQIGEGSKINHLAYVGDSTVGRDVNIGAGSYTCNYDGATKHQTVIGDGVFIGSGVQMVAPVTIGDGATIGAGTTLAHDAPAGELTVGRAKAETIPGWKRPQKS